ncbi:MAG TPA: ABC transporter substrate-binding protein, partial [Roseiflexaceae bacterium]|nr:ABC transporter substrate-binding protein [Roseiflexaceae bacterium]
MHGFRATVVALIALLLASCGSTASQSSTPGPAGAALPSDPGPDIGRISILGPFSGAEAVAFEEVIKVFEAANPGIDVVYTGVGDFDTQIVVRVQAGDPPDIAAFPQPGGAARLARDGLLVPLWPEAQATLDTNFAPFWKQLGTFEGQPYGMFHRVNAKGWIWYNKPAFEQAGYTVPKTWEELTALTEKMKASGTSPWCEGMESGQATGWKGTDWIENIMLRTQPVETYDEWTAGRLPFSSPEVKGAFEILGSIWLDPSAVYGGYPTIVLTRFSDAATFLFDNPPRCWLHMQGSFVT